MARTPCRYGMVSHVTEDFATPTPTPTPTHKSASPAWVPQPATHRSLRFGLVGTGYWARVAHARALASAPGIEFAAVWGRNSEAAATLAADHGISSHGDFDAFLADVDGVAFSVPPDVQSELAVRAAQAGKHLLLEKPVALTEAAAEALAMAVEVAGVAAVVFFTCRFQPGTAAWLKDLATTGGWQGASALWLGSAHSPASPFNTPWRQQKGGLWDLGPHTVSLVWEILGPVESVTADVGRGDLTHLVLHHQGGATSTVTVTLGAPEPADGFDLHVWGDRGRSAMPPLAEDPVVALRIALTELADRARSGNLSHPCDAKFGLAVTRVLAQAQLQVDMLRNV